MFFMYARNSVNSGFVLSFNECYINHLVPDHFYLYLDPSCNPVSHQYFSGLSHYCDMKARDALANPLFVEKSYTSLVFI